MKSRRIELDAIATFDNVLVAALKAACSKRNRPEVAAFFADFEAHLNRLGADIRNERVPYGEFKSFYIRDPKLRLIHAACFRDRVLHHAIMNHAAPVLERAMSPAAYACLPGKGIHSAGQRVQAYIRRYAWYVKIDIQSYFQCIDHAILYQLLTRRFKGADFMRLLRRIIEGYHATPGKGLPIGSLTSQYFANYYLDQVDRLLLAHPLVRAELRYMDDIIWWCDSREAAKETLAWIRKFIETERLLTIKNNVQINRSSHGVSYCGYRILPGALRLGRRRQRQYRVRRCYWESLYRQGALSEAQLQQAYAAVHAITSGADACGFRQKNLCLRPPPDV